MPHPSSTTIKINIGKNHIGLESYSGRNLSIQPKGVMFLIHTKPWAMLPKPRRKKKATAGMAAITRALRRVAANWDVKTAKLPKTSAPDKIQSAMYAACNGLTCMYESRPVADKISQAARKVTPQAPA